MKVLLKKIISFLKEIKRKVKSIINIFTNPLKKYWIKYNLKRHMISITGSFTLFILFFSYGVYHNLSFSYMGNTSERMVQFIFDNFLGDIFHFMSKLLAIYIFISFIVGAVVHFFLLSLAALLGKEVKNYHLYLFNLLISFIVYLPFFLFNLVKYPQLFINGFYLKSGFFSSMTDFFADNLSPMFMAVLLIIFITTMVVTILMALIKLKRKRILNALGVFCFFILFIVIFNNIEFNVNLNQKRNNSKKNIIILASDALRPDRLSAYNYKRKTSPNLDKIIKEGVSFRDARIEVPRTFPSWVSILSGQYASTHGVRHMFPTSRDINRNFTSIVKELNKAGYFTAAVADYAGDIFTRVDLGFKKVDTPFFNTTNVLNQAILDTHVFLLPFLTNQMGLEVFPVLKDSAYFCPPEMVEERVINTIKESGNKPFFITTFFSSTHFPYAPPHPYYKLYSKKGYRGPYKYLKQKIISLNGKAVKEKMSEKDIHQINALYDGGVKAFDDSAGRILDFLRKNRLMDNTIVVILADHGENIYEGNLGMGHGEHFRGELSTRIPLIIYDKDSSFGAKNIDRVVRHVDVAPTLLNLVGVKAPENMEGTSLKPMMEGQRGEDLYAYGETGIWFDNTQDPNLFFQSKRIIYPDITYLAYIDFNFRSQMVLSDDYRGVVNLAKHRYIYDGDYKLIYMPLKDRVEYELYDVKNDPLGEKNIIKEKPLVFKRLKGELFKWFNRNRDVIIKKDFIFPMTRY